MNTLRLICTCLGPAVLLACGGGPTEIEEQDLPFGEEQVGSTVVRTYTVGVIADTLVLAVQLRNVGSFEDRFSISASCPLRLLVFENPAREGMPVWDERRAGLVCPADAVDVVLGPGGAREVLRVMLVGGILGDSLKSRRYFFSGVVSIKGSTTTIRAGSGLLNRG